MTEQRYKCPQCGWIGTTRQMLADAAEMGDDEFWSNWICPSCGEWWQLENYTLLEEGQ